MSHIRTAAIAAITTISLTSAAGAAPLDPNAFAAIGTLGGGAITIDTDALTVDGGAGGILVPQGGAPYAEKSGGAPDIAVFTFGGGSILGDVTITGSRAAAILFKGAGTVTGTIDVSGASVVGATHNGALGAVGGGRGGQGGPFTAGPHDGFGPGGGTAGTTSAPTSGAGPGSGGGFGTAGGNAGAGVTFVSGGIAYGDIVTELIGGSGGGGGGGHNGGIGGGGGAGGGALEIGALTDLFFTGATLRSDGGDGGHLAHGGGGGGSGGGILLHGFNVSIDASSIISANGGDGGWGGNFLTPDGSCGGGGRIAVISNTAGSQTVDGTVESNAGASGQGVACNFVSTPLFLTDPEIGEGSVVAMSAPGMLALLGLGAGFVAWRRRK